METKLNNTLKNPASCGIFYFTTLLLLLSFAAAAQPQLNIANAKKNRGEVMKGDTARYAYDIKNTGNQPLLINSAEVSCSCTSVDYPKQPILPGQSAQVIVLFDTKSARGRQDRFVLLSSNDLKGPHKLRYKVFVKTP